MMAPMTVSWEVVSLEDVLLNPPQDNPEWGTRQGFLRSCARSRALEIAPTCSGRRYVGNLALQGDLVLDCPLTWIRGDLHVTGNLLSPDRNALLVEGAVIAKNGLLSRAFMTGPISVEGVIVAHEISARQLQAQFLLLGPDEKPDLEQKGKTPLVTIGKKTKKSVPPEWLDKRGQVDRFSVSASVKAGWPSTPT